MIIGVTGSIASGKSVLIEKLIEKGFIYHKISEEVREEAKKLGILIERKPLQDLGNAMREKYGNGYWAERLLPKIESGENHVVDGIRNPGEIDVLKKLKNFILIGVDAPIEQRFDRILNRNKDSDPKTIEEIRAIDSRDRGVGEPNSGQQSTKCYEMADVSLQNDSTFEELFKKVGELLETLKC
ncbi:MAG TPA: AAA family ATPase [Candidatus Nanoarchaeia archaeon]|nr:AAA family ATPase [Candidatus Nanoarchaeia archaeon]